MKRTGASEVDGADYNFLLGLEVSNCYNTVSNWAKWLGVTGAHISVTDLSVVQMSFKSQMLLYMGLSHRHFRKG